MTACQGSGWFSALADSEAAARAAWEQHQLDKIAAEQEASLNL